MRRFFILCLIAMLPLRAWSSDLMSISMALQAPPAVGLNQVPLQTPGLLLDQQPNEPLKADCADAPSGIASTADLSQSGPASAESESDASPMSPHCHGCTSCQLCMALVTGYASVQVHLPAFAAAAVVQPNVGFTSAERASGFKPPIS